MTTKTFVAHALRTVLNRIEPARGSDDALLQANPRGPTMALPRQLWEQVTALDSLNQAWAKVRANGGVAGTDGETLQSFARRLDANLRRLQRDLETSAYRPEPVRRVLIPKPNGGQRPLSILAVRDRVAQRAVYDALAPFYETRFLDCSYAFREGRSTQDAVNAIATWRERGLFWVADGDIAQYFERIDHDVLMQQLADDIHDRRVLRLLRLWLRARVLNEMADKKPIGTPQGGVISPLLSNVYLHTFDVAMTEQKLALVRYADDWVILCRSEAAAQAALQAASDALARLKLALNPHRTRVTHFEKGFSFVGAFFVKNQQYWISAGHS